MRLCLPHFISTGQVPDLEHSVTTATCKSVQSLRISCNLVNSVYMTSSELSNEGRRKHSLEFHGIQSSSIFSCLLEWMQGRIEISRLAGDIAAGGLYRARRARKCFDFLSLN